MDPTEIVAVPRISDSHVAFLRSEQGYLSEHIRMADQKATAMLAISLGALGYLFSKGRYADIFRLHPAQWALTHPLELVSVLLLLIGLGTALLVLLPRFRKSPNGLIFWEAVARHGSGQNYLTAVSALSSSQLAEHICDHCMAAANVASHKYRLLRVCFWTAPFGALLGVMTTLFR